MNTIKSQHTLRRSLAASALALAAAFAVPAFAAQPAASSNYGTPVHAGQADREIRLDPATRWVNVQQNETVRFVVGGQNFTWRFDTLGTPTFDLNQVAPAGMLGGAPITVYVAPDPHYIGG
jgi:hypothetical protein